MRRCLLLTIAAACSTSATSAPSVPSKPVPAAPAPAAFVATPVAYAEPIAQPVRRYCPSSPAPVPAPKPDPGNAGKMKTYDFTPIAIDARLGYTASTQPRSSFTRDPEAIRRAIERAAPRMSECMRVARPGLRTRRDLLDAFVELDVDPFGAIGNVTVDAPKPLEGCLQAALLGVRVRRQTARITHAKIRIDFSNISSAAPLKILPAAPPAAAASGHCLIASDPLPIDEPTLTPIAIDFEPRPPAVRNPRDRRFGCRPLDVDKLQIRRAVLAVHGDLRTCYLDALARKPDLEGTVEAQFVIGPGGELAQVAVTGAGDDPMHACFADVLSATAAASEPSGPVLVNMPFTLTRSATGFDREAAAKSAAERARVATTADASCRARVALLDAYRGADLASTQPVGITIDPRVITELESFSAFVAANPGPALAGCLDELAPTLVELARLPMKTDGPERMLAARGNGLAEAIERSQRIVELFPYVEKSLLLFIADGLAMLDQPDEARDAYLRFMSLVHQDRDELERVADSFARVTRNRDDHLLWDDCPR